MKKELPDYVRGALAKARLALENASRLDKQPRKRPASQKEQA